MEIYGNDFSKHQGTVDWETVKAAGKTQFAILRAGYGRVDSQVDTQWERNYSECKRLGIPVGAYWYSYAVTEEQARQEMRCFLRALNGKQLEYPVYFDQEYEPAIKALTTEKRTDIVIAALKELEKAGYYAGLYCSRDWLNNWLDSARLSAYDLWIADYTSTEPSPAKLPYGMRQVDSGNSFGVPGFGSSLDCDVAYRDYPSIIKGSGLNGWKDGADTPGGARLQKLCIISPSDGLIARAASLGLPVQDVSAALIGPASDGDAMALWMQAQAEGSAYFASYTEE